ncbi:hypothetical protein [Paenibacillus sp. HB172176]|uniref:hypothetical protein n=1 Tax=Paenibacillus sp. HB172176 TaxID=2493690 RepID=UPI00143C72CC|nr:hypothetical protein [Paenibacillus sp. HB172176]
MKELIIDGTGVHALEMAEIVERINADRQAWHLLGFLEEAQYTEESLLGYPVFRELDFLIQRPHVFIATDHERKLANLFPRERFATLIDPSSFVSRTASIGNGCVIYPNCFIGLHAEIGDFVFCLSGAIINHDCRIGERTVIASGVKLAGSVMLEADCYIGQGANIRQRVRVGGHSLIGMSGNVLKDVAPYSIMVGNPAELLQRSGDSHSG